MAEEGDGEDAHDSDQGHEQGVLHEGGTTLGVAEASTQVSGNVFVTGQHRDDSLDGGCLVTQSSGHHYLRDVAARSV